MNVELGSVEFIIINIIIFYYILFPSGAGPELLFQSWAQAVTVPAWAEGTAGGPGSA